jgi:glycine/serine hydroxymethyltransferase
MHIIAAKAVAFGEILKDNKKERKVYTKQVVKNAQILAEILIKK